MRTIDKNLLKTFQDRPCDVCGASPPSDPSHIRTRGSGGPDEEFNLVSKCRKHHMEWHQVGPVRFCDKYFAFHDLLKQKGWEWIGNKLWNQKLLK